MTENPEELALFRVLHWPESLTPDDLVVLKRVEPELCLIGLARWRWAICPERMSANDHERIHSYSEELVYRLAGDVRGSEARRQREEREALKTARTKKQQATRLANKAKAYALNAPRQPTSQEKQQTVTDEEAWSQRTAGFRRYESGRPRDEGGDVVFAGVPVSLSKPDPFYEQETALYRVPASLNWPHGRIRPKIRRLNEGFQRTHQAWL